MKKKFTSKILIAVFCLFIGIIGLLYVFLPKSEYSVTEKRYLAPFPQISFNEIKSGRFSEKFEGYLADHTPLRKFFVSLNAYAELIAGNNGSNSIYLGKEGWLIEKPFDNNNKFNINIERINNFSAKLNKPVTIMAVPSKGYIYGDKLPKNALRYNDSTYQSLLDKINNKNISIINLIPAFTENKDKNLYYKTDHHWTSEGAFTAYNEFCKSKNISCLNIDDYEIETVKNFYGTSYSKSCYTFTKPDEVNIYKNKISKGTAKVKVYEGKKISDYDNMFFKNRYTEDDKYLIFLDGNHSRVDIETDNNKGVLLLIKDSFAHCLAPFLSENYSKIVMIDLRYYIENIENLIEEENVDEIMFVYSIENLATSKDIIF